MDKRSYDRSESIVVNGKDFHFTPDRKEFLSTLTKAFPNQTSFTKEDFDAIVPLNHEMTSFELHVQFVPIATMSRWLQGKFFGIW